MVAVYFFWGSTAPAIKVAVGSIPPALVAATRFFVAATLLWSWARLRGLPLPAAEAWRSAAIVGALTLAAGNGLFSFALTGMPSGLAQLMFALAPMWNALIAAAFYRERLQASALAGIALGFGGIAYLVSPGDLAQLPAYAVVLALTSSLAWSAGSMIQRRFRSTDLLQASAMQMYAGAAILAVVALVAGERFEAAEFTPASIAALAWLILFGSVVAYSAFVFLTRNVATSLASTYLYVNPIVAIALGATFLHEPLTRKELVAAAVVLTGVALMLVPPRRASQ